MARRSSGRRPRRSSRLLVVAASLEAALGFCLGCRVFAVLMRLGVIPDDVCAECNDLSLRYPDLAGAEG